MIKELMFFLTDFDDIFDDHINDETIREDDQINVEGKEAKVRT